MVMGTRKVKILAWYDNEWGYSKRVVDLVGMVTEQFAARGRRSPPKKRIDNERLQRKY
ncbi:hypothetical protein GCM10020331_032740 [Ectobacillus funiculus]